MNVALRPANAGYRHIDILSLCTGGGGLDLGIELAVPGARSVCMVEREAFAVAHLVSAMQSGLLAPAPVWSDARTFDGRRWRGAVDGVIGGIPCQPHSLAGRKRGSLDERDLWSDARRVVVQARAWFCLIENVGGMLSAGADEVAGAERVWRDLRKLGFAVEIGLFTAAEVGAPHERERLFILGVHDELADAGNRGAFGEPGDLCAPAGGDRSIEKNGAERDAGHGGAGMADAICEGLEGSERRASRPGVEGSAVERGGEGAVDAARHRGREGRQVAKVGQLTGCTDFDGTGLFPPGPADLDRWRGVLAHSPDLEPAVRRMADGWPPGWTSLALTPPASSGCACSATALSAWKARMRSALSQLALPAEAPPAPLALFG